MTSRHDIPPPYKPPRSPKFPSQEVRDVLKWAVFPSAVLALIMYLMVRGCFI